MSELPENEELLSEIRQRFAKDFLDMVVLTIIRIRPMWGYKLMGEIKRDFGVKISYGVMYPLLRSLETKGLIKGRLELRGKKRRKVYEIMPRGIELIKAHNEFLREQLKMSEVMF